MDFGSYCTIIVGNSRFSLFLPIFPTPRSMRTRHREATQHSIANPCGNALLQLTMPELFAAKHSQHQKLWSCPEIGLFHCKVTHLLVWPSFPLYFLFYAECLYAFTALLEACLEKNSSKQYCRNYKWFQKDTNTCHGVLWLEIAVEPECDVVDWHGSTGSCWDGAKPCQQQISYQCYWW